MSMNDITKVSPPKPAPIEPRAYDMSELVPNVFFPSGQDSVICGYGPCSESRISDSRDLLAWHRTVVAFEADPNLVAGADGVFPVGAGSADLFTKGVGDAGWSTLGFRQVAWTDTIAEWASSLYTQGGTSADQNCQRVDFGISFYPLGVFIAANTPSNGLVLSQPFEPKTSTYSEFVTSALANTVVVKLRSRLFNMEYVARTLAEMIGTHGFKGSLGSLGDLTSIQYMPFNSVIISTGQTQGDQLSVSALNYTALTLENDVMAPLPASLAAGLARFTVLFCCVRYGATVSVDMPGKCGRVLR